MTGFRVETDDPANDFSPVSSVPFKRPYARCGPARTKSGRIRRHLCGRFRNDSWHEDAGLNIGWTYDNNSERIRPVCIDIRTACGFSERFPCGTAAPGVDLPHVAASAAGGLRAQARLFVATRRLRRFNRSATPGCRPQCSALRAVRPCVTEATAVRGGRHGNYASAFDVRSC